MEKQEETELTESKGKNIFSMKRIQKDITTVDYGIICHQVNAQGVMGAGLSANIKIKFPSAFKDYRKVYETGGMKLGTLIISPIKENLYVAHIVGQNKYGRGRTFTNYQALNIALNRLKKFRGTLDEDLPIYFPYRMGSGLGGGSWRIVKDIIEEFHPDAIICQL